MWHPDVRFFKLSVQGQPKAYFYLDPYSRPEEKRGGAWMAEVCLEHPKTSTPYRTGSITEPCIGLWGLRPACSLHAVAGARPFFV